MSGAPSPTTGSGAPDEAVRASGATSVDAPLPSETKRCPTCGERYPLDYAVCPRDATPLAREGQSGDPLLGQVLGDTYDITRLLGEGGMGRVYEARHVRLGRRFALKMLHPRLLGDADSIARFRREATAAGSVVSPYVAQVVDVHATRDGQPYIVSELLEGDEFANVIHDESPLEISRVVAIARQICRGLGAAHAVGVVHRDLKPENIMLVRDADGAETAKVLDFGIAKSLADDHGLTRTGMVLGTPAYMAPEQARSGSGLDHRVDIYALGAVLYRALTGKPAFSGGDPSTTLSSVLYDEPERPKTLRKDLPDGLELAIQRAMSKDPAARFSSMAEFDAALATFDTGSPSTGEMRAMNPSATTSPAPREIGGAPTVAFSEAGGALPSGFSDGARARSARPRLVGYGLLAFGWTYIALCGLVAATVKAISGRALQPLEALLSMALGAVVVAPLVVTWVRGLVKGAWRNTAEMLARSERQASLALASLAAYALVAVTWRTFESVIVRRAATPRWSEVAALGASLIVAAVMAAAQRRHRR